MSAQQCSKITNCLQELLDLSGLRRGRETNFVQRRSNLTAELFVKTLAAPRYRSVMSV